MSRVADESENENISLPPIRKPGPIKIWKTVDGFKTVGGVSKPVKIVIQEIPEDRYEDMLDHFTTHFIGDEPCCVSIKLKDDPVGIKDLRNIWKIILKQGLSVGAFVDDPKGGKPEIAGGNMLGYEIKDDDRKIDKYKMKPSAAKRLVEPALELYKEAKVFEHYNTNKHLFALGLIVQSCYRGHGLGAHILSVREKIGREYKIPMTTTPFSSTISQKSAARCGFELILSRDYDQILDEEGKEVFPGIKFKSMQVMGRRLF
ncbi:arylalkylamine N-acetyltransferase-like 2 isoform X1 [Vespula squamosa]|uniref:Arylalkylamine N-acetyltransferase-like 2 isoform X1 n=1 Tax=Vespula squamosa TaxID=30214 RepID=A0ABD2A9X8_VESSQ